MGFVCRVRASTDNPDPPPKPKCQDIYSDYDQWLNGCYKTNEEAKTWQEAEQSCGSLGGGHLASILTQAEQGKNYRIIISHSLKSMIQIDKWQLLFSPNIFSSWNNEKFSLTEKYVVKSTHC